MRVIYAILFGLVLGAVFAIGYYLNSKTPKPPGCENESASCSGCNIVSCSHHPAQQNGAKEEN